MESNKLYNLIILIFFLLIIEFFAGYIHSNIQEQRNQAKIKWKKLIRLNSLGYRDVEHVIGKKKGMFRIVVLGDSQAYGALIAKGEDIFPRKLESLLNHGLNNPRFEVINISKPGWGTGDQFTAFLLQGIKYKPDLVLISFFHNDVPILGDISAQTCGDPFVRFLNTDLKLAYEILKKSILLKLSVDGISNFRKIAGWAPGYGDCLNNLYGTRGWELQKIYFDLFDFVSRRIGSHLMIGVLPFVGSSLEENYPLLEGEEIVGKYCGKRGIQCVNFYKSGFRGKSPVELSVSYPDVHFNPYGAHLIAKILSDRLKPIKDIFQKGELPEDLSIEKYISLMEPSLGSAEGEGNPLLRFKTLVNFVFDNQLEFADPLYFERSWIPHLSERTSPDDEKVIYIFLKFFYLWRNYFDRLVAMVLNDNPTTSFVRILKKVYEEEKEKKLLENLRARFPGKF